VRERERETESKQPLTLAMKDKSCIRAIQLLARSFTEAGNSYTAIRGRLASMIAPRGESDALDLRSGPTLRRRLFLIVSKCTKVMVGLCSFSTEYPFMASNLGKVNIST